MLFSLCPAALTAHWQPHGQAAALARCLPAWLTTSSNAKCKSDVIATAPHLPNQPTASHTIAPAEAEPEAETNKPAYVD
ncbi:hypothetical protein ACLKA7_002216 [Drosophila subpalustris]